MLLRPLFVRDDEVSSVFEVQRRRCLQLNRHSDCCVRRENIKMRSLVVNALLNYREGLSERNVGNI